MKHLLARVVVASLIALAPAGARADERYQLEIAATDLAGAGLFFPGALLRDAGGRDTTASESLMLAGAGLFLLGGPTVHLAHHEYARAGASFGLRLAMAKLGSFLGKRLNACRPDRPSCAVSDLAIGPTIAAFLDVFVIAPRPGGPASPDGALARALGSSGAVGVGAIGHF